MIMKYGSEVLRDIPGGRELLEKLSRVGPQRAKSLREEAAVALAQKMKGANIEAIGKEIPRRRASKGTLTEIDVENDAEIIQVKGGDYSQTKKLSGQDMRQLIETKRYNEQLRRNNTTGEKLPPKKVVYQFHKGLVSYELEEWLESKGVEVREGIPLELLDF